MTELRSFAVMFVVAATFIGCSSDDSPAGPSTPTEGGSDGPSPSVKITKPHQGDSFVITADSVDVDVDFDVQHFELVLLGQEGTDMGKGQVRLYVDGSDCNDPGDPGPPAEPPLDYNKIFPNDMNEKHVGMDYCAGGVPAIDNKTHTLKAQLWHGAMALTEPTATDQITFKTTFSAEDGSAPEGGNDAAATPADGSGLVLDAGALVDVVGQ